MKAETFQIFFPELLMSFQQIILHPKVRSFWGGIIPSEKNDETFQRPLLKIYDSYSFENLYQSSEVLHLSVHLKKYIRSIVGRDIPGVSKNKPFWISNIEAVIFYLCSPKFVYYLCNALCYCKKKVRVILGAFAE